MQAPATHQNTDQQRAGNTPRRFHITHHVDVDGTVQALCGLRFTPAGKRTATLGCPICEAMRSLEQVQL